MEAASPMPGPRCAPSFEAAEVIDGEGMLCHAGPVQHAYPYAHDVLLRSIGSDLTLDRWLNGGHFPRGKASHH